MKHYKQKEKDAAKLLCNMQTCAAVKNIKKHRRILPKGRWPRLNIVNTTICSLYFPTLEEWIRQAVKHNICVGWNYDGSAWKIDLFQNMGPGYDVVESHSWSIFLWRCQLFHRTSDYPNQTQICKGIIEAFLRNKFFLFWWVPKKLVEQGACKFL